MKSLQECFGLILGSSGAVTEAHTPRDAIRWLRSACLSGSICCPPPGNVCTTSGFGSQKRDSDCNLVNGTGDTWYYIACQLPPRLNGHSA